MVICTLDTDCSFQYYCNTNHMCQHYPVFPLRLYPSLIYLLLPIALTICNLGGLSGGAFKVVIFLNMLNYSIGEATLIIYVVIAGGALANLITLISRKHPNGLTSLIDYNIVYIMFPGLLLGTTFGVIVSTIIISFIQYLITFVFLFLFGVIYARKYLKLKKSMKAQKQDSNESMIQSQSGNSYIDTNINTVTSQNITQKQQSQFYRQQKGLHLKQIIITVILFGILTVVLNFAQGKIIKFSQCDFKYWIGLVAYTLTVIFALILIYKYIQYKMKIYKKNQFSYPLQLDNAKLFSIIALVGLGAGFCQGIMGLGSGFIIIYTLLYYKMPPLVVSAISGYMIFFTGLSSFLEALFLGKLLWQDCLLFFFLTFIGSYVLTELIRKKLKDNPSFDAIILLIMVFIVVISTSGIVVSVIQTVEKVGFSGMFIAKKFC